MTWDTRDFRPRWKSWRTLFCFWFPKCTQCLSLKLSLYPGNVLIKENNKDSSCGLVLEISTESRVCELMGWMGCVVLVEGLRCSVWCGCKWVLEQRSLEKGVRQDPFPAKGANALRLKNWGPWTRRGGSWTRRTWDDTGYLMASQNLRPAVQGAPQLMLTQLPCSTTFFVNVWAVQPWFLCLLTDLWEGCLTSYLESELPLLDASSQVSNNETLSLSASVPPRPRTLTSGNNVLASQLLWLKVFSSVDCSGHSCPILSFLLFPYPRPSCYFGWCPVQNLACAPICFLLLW